MTNKGPRGKGANYDQGEQPWFKKSVEKRRKKSKMQKASRKRNR